MSKTTLTLRYISTLLKYNLIKPFHDIGATKRFVSAVLDFNFHEGGGRLLKTTSIHEVFPELVHQNWVMVGTSWPVEAPFLCGALKVLGAKRILEIGTFHGGMTIQLAANIEKDGLVHTIDLDPNESDKLVLTISSYDKELVDKNSREEVGKAFHGTVYEDRIIQTYCDSAILDFSKFQEPFDLAFIDGGHSYEQVKMDTENVLSIMRPGGCIFWHDYQPGCEGVVKYLHELSRDFDIKHINNSMLAVLLLPV